MRAWLFVLALLAAPASAREMELGLESFLYRTASTPLNRDNVLGLDPDEGLLRGTLAAKETRGELRLVFRGYLERRFGSGLDETDATVRQAYIQYGWGSAVSLRVGKQRIAWGSGFAWNPTNRVEPPKNPLNTGLEQEGALAARMDWTPAAWGSVILLAAKGETTPGDLPFATPTKTRRTAAVRARFLVHDTDLAVIYSGGANQRTLVGLDLARDVPGNVSVHFEGAFYRGAETAPPRDGDGFFRLVIGALRTFGESMSASAEYFYNGEGYTRAALTRYLDGLDASYAGASDPRLPAPQRQAALGAYLQGAAIPFSGGLGLRRHYLQAAWTRATPGGRWTTALRGVVSLSDGGTAVTPGIGYAPRGNLTLGLDAVLLLGPGDSEYRLLPLRAAVQARIKVVF